jgi:hypothetical protein
MVLDALCQSLPPTATVGEIVDAATMLGFPEVGELSLADLADALLSPDGVAVHERSDAATGDVVRPAVDAADDTDDDDDDSDDDREGDDDDDDDDDDDAPERAAPAAARGKGRTAAVAKPAKVAAPPKSTKAGKGGKAIKVSLDERMSPEEAAAALLPLVEQLGEATMQQLEEATAGGGRRKLRFHIGQLVKNGRLARHGMGRGTYYTLS